MYITHPQYDYPVLIPWHDSFDSIYQAVNSESLLSQDRFYYLLNFLLQTKSLDGHVCECGVYKGGSAKAIATGLQKFNIKKKLLLLDTFSGCPPETISPNDYHKEHDFKETSYKVVKDLLSNFYNIEIYPGKIPDSLSDISNNKFSFVHLDLDNYLPTLCALQFFHERIVSGGIIIIDDYGFPIYKQSAKKAVDEFCNAKGLLPLVLFSGQAVIVKEKE